MRLDLTSEYCSGGVGGSASQGDWFSRHTLASTSSAAGSISATSFSAQERVRGAEEKRAFDACFRILIAMLNAEDGQVAARTRRGELRPDGGRESEKREREKKDRLRVEQMLEEISFYE